MQKWWAAQPELRLQYPPLMTTALVYFPNWQCSLRLGEKSGRAIAPPAPVVPAALIWLLLYTTTPKQMTGNAILLIT